MNDATFYRTSAGAGVSSRLSTSPQRALRSPSGTAPLLSGGLCGLWPITGSAQLPSQAFLMSGSHGKIPSQGSFMK